MYPSLSLSWACALERSVINLRNIIPILQTMYNYAVRHWAKPADPHIVNAAGYTPLTLAAKLGRREIFEEMLEHLKVVRNK